MLKRLFRGGKAKWRDLVNILRYPALLKGFFVYSHLTSDERVCLYRLSKESQAGFSLEIGSYIGASAYFISAGLVRKENGSQLLCVDTWSNDAMTEGHLDTWEEFCFNTKVCSSSIIPIRGYSTQVVDDVRRHTAHLSMLFIDGNHSYEGVKSDWESYKTLLHPGSVVIFHDYGWAEGVQRVVDEDVVPLVTCAQRLPNMWWGTITSQP